MLRFTFFFKQNAAYELRISDWSSDVCSSDLVQIGVGEFAKHGITSRESHVSEWNQTEERYKERRGMVDGRRLSCQALLQQDVVVDVPAESQVHKQVVRKRAVARAIELEDRKSTRLNSSH